MRRRFCIRSKWRNSRISARSFLRMPNRLFRGTALLFCQPLATSRSKFYSHSTLTLLYALSLPLFSSADSSPAVFNSVSSKHAPSLLSVPEVAPTQTYGPITAPIDIHDKVISVVYDYARYYWRRRDIFVELPLRVAVAICRFQTNLCEVIYDVWVSCRRKWYFNFDDADALIFDL